MTFRHGPTTMIALFLFSACSPTDPAYDLKPFSSCASLEASIKDQAMTEIRWDHSWGGFQGGFGAKEHSFSGGDVGVMSEDSGSTGHSTTNVQVEGVDELDLMETDGEYIFAIAADRLVATKVWPPEEAAVASHLDVEGVPKGIFLLEGGHLVLISQLAWGQSGHPISGQSVEGAEDGLSDEGNRSSRARISTSRLSGTTQTISSGSSRFVP